MIPKKIHYCWFGSAEMPAEFKAFISEWSEIMPDYEIKLWNEDNAPMHLAYMKKALKHKKWANLSNYTRLHAVYEEGGVYFDTDVKVVKPFDDLLSNKCFFGLQSPDWDEINSFNNAIFGAEKNNFFIKKIMDACLALYDGSEIAHLSSPHLTTYLLRESGYKAQTDKVLLDNDVQIYPQTYFFPYHWKEKFTEDKITSNTYAIHFWSGTWAEKKKKKKNHLLRRIAYRAKKKWQK